MLIDIALDPDCFVDGTSSLAERARIRAVLERFGILSASKGEILRIRDAMRHRTLEWKQLEEVILKVPKRLRFNEIGAEVDPGSLGLGSQESLVILGDRLAGAWFQAVGSPLDEGVATVPGTATEFVHARHITDSQLVDERERWAQCDLVFPAGGSEAWGRLASLFVTATKVSVVDRFQLGPVETTHFNSPGHSGLLWLADRIGVLPMAPADRIDLRLYAQLPDAPWDDLGLLGQLADDVYRRCSTAVAHMTISFVADRFFRGIEHGRYLRFATTRCQRLVSLDHSLDQFGSRPFTVPVRMSYRAEGSDRELYRAQEERLSLLASEAGTSFSRTS